MVSQVSSHIEPLGSNQDHCITGDNKDYKYLIIMDGHGPGKCITKLKEMNWSVIIDKSSAKEILTAINREILINCPLLKGDGSTISIVKIYSNKIQVYWLGDSQVHLQVDGNYYKTNNHNTSNPDECARETKIVTLNDTFNVVSATGCTVKKGTYFMLSNDDILTVSRSLGHNFVTYQQFEEMEIPLLPTSTFKILAATDGLYDMLYEEDPLNMYPDYTAEDFTNLAKMRWKQTWAIQNGPGVGDIFYQSFEQDMDDIAVIVYENA